MIRRALIAAGSATVAVLAVVPGVPERMLGDSFVLASALISWAFTIGYWRFSEWRLYEAGRAMLYLLASFAVVCTQLSASNWLGTDYPFWAEIRMIAYAGVMFTTFNLIYTWHRERTRDLPSHI